jgi:hypothetical protein
VGRSRFATDIMAEHALFLRLLMPPPEVAEKERVDALRFERSSVGRGQAVGLCTPDQPRCLARQCCFKPRSVRATRPQSWHFVSEGAARSTVVIEPLLSASGGTSSISAADCPGSCERP